MGRPDAETRMIPYLRSLTFPGAPRRILPARTALAAFMNGQRGVAVARLIGL